LWARSADIFRLIKLEREKCPYLFASHFQKTPLSLTKTLGKSRAGWGALEVSLEVSAERSMRIVGVRNFETSLKSPPPVVPLEIS
jgi:hypothetical protein